MLPHGKWEDRFGYTFASFPASDFRRPAGSVAQLVEQRTENPCVGGSIPPRATILLRYVLDRWFTERTDHIVNTFGPKGFSSGSSIELSKSELPRW